MLLEVAVGAQQLEPPRVADDLAQVCLEAVPPPAAVPFVPANSILRVLVVEVEGRLASVVSATLAAPSEERPESRPLLPLPVTPPALFAATASLRPPLVALVREAFATVAASSYATQVDAGAIVVAAAGR
jgi:hypothetical protein